MQNKYLSETGQVVNYPSILDGSLLLRPEVSPHGGEMVAADAAKLSRIKIYDLLKTKFMPEFDSLG
jgi:hypothetical protein